MEISPCPTIPALRRHVTVLYRELAGKDYERGKLLTLCYLGVIINKTNYKFCNGQQT
jgi:hypothetical protein